MWQYGYSPTSWLWMAGMMTLMTVLTAITVVVVVRAVRRGRADGADEARRVLDARYARGEVGHDEYQQRRRLLTAPGTPDRARRTAEEER